MYLYCSPIPLGAPSWGIYRLSQLFSVLLCVGFMCGAWGGRQPRGPVGGRLHRLGPPFLPQGLGLSAGPGGGRPNRNRPPPLPWGRGLSAGLGGAGRINIHIHISLYVYIHICIYMLLIIKYIENVMIVHRSGHQSG